MDGHQGIAGEAALDALGVGRHGLEDLDAASVHGHEIARPLPVEAADVEHRRLRPEVVLEPQRVIAVDPPPPRVLRGRRSHVGQPFAHALPRGDHPRAGYELVLQALQRRDQQRGWAAAGRAHSARDHRAARPAPEAERI